MSAIRRTPRTAPTAIPAIAPVPNLLLEALLFVIDCEDDELKAELPVGVAIEDVEDGVALVPLDVSNDVVVLESRGKFIPLTCAANATFLAVSVMDVVRKPLTAS